MYFGGGEGSLFFLAFLGFVFLKRHQGGKGEQWRALAPWAPTASPSLWVGKAASSHFPSPAFFLGSCPTGCPPSSFPSRKGVQPLWTRQPPQQGLVVRTSCQPAVSWGCISPSYHTHFFTFSDNYLGPSATIYCDQCLSASLLMLSRIRYLPSYNDFDPSIYYCSYWIKMLQTGISKQNK